MQYFDNIISLDGVNGFEVNSFLTHAYNAKFDFTLVKHNDFFYVEVEESEPEYMEQGNRIYLLDKVWYMRFDYVKWEKAYHNNELDPDNFDIYEYEL